jgi:hypothetical protein
VSARVATIACAFGAAGFGSEGEANPSCSAQSLASLLRPACTARLATYVRAWLRCVVAVAPPSAGVDGLAPHFKETLDYYASALSEARAASVAQADADGEPVDDATDALGSDTDDDGAEGRGAASVLAADAPTASPAEPAAAQLLSARLARRRERLNLFTASLSPACYLAFANCARTALVPQNGFERSRCVAHLRAWLAPAELAAEGKAMGAWVNAISFLVRDRIAEVCARPRGAERPHAPREPRRKRLRASPPLPALALSLARVAAGSPQISSFALRRMSRFLSQVVAAALDTRSGEWPERARKPLTLAEVDEGIAAVGMEPVLSALKRAVAWMPD